MKKILIVDDSRDIVSSLVDLFEESGYLVFTANNANEGIKIAKEVLPDMILCDILMPETTGYECMEKLKIENETKDTPVILISAKAEKADIKRGLELGAVEYLVKPFDSIELLKTVETYMSKFH